MNFSPEQIRLGNRRLAKLADFMENEVPTRNFDITSWTSCGPRLDEALYGENLDGVTDEEATKLICNSLQRHECGTSGCVVGWAPVCFPTLLRYDSTGDVVSRENNLENARAACAIFFLTDEEGKRIFFDEAYHVVGKVTPKMVAKRLRLMVRIRKLRLKKREIREEIQQLEESL